jgi:hypothetical protein
MNEVNSIFKQQDIFKARMITAFNEGKIAPAFAPYIHWKEGKGIFTKAEAFEMREVARDKLVVLYDAEEPDAEALEYLEAIEDELCNILVCYSTCLK